MQVFGVHFTVAQILFWVSAAQSAVVTERIAVSPRIIGGSDGTIEEFPYQLSLRLNGRHWCGASVIGDKWALTAAHCLSEASGPSEVTLRGGSTSYSSGGTLVDAQNLYIHPNFNATSGDFDVALISTKSSLSGENIESITLANEGASIPVGSKATISGWGLTDTSSSVNPTILQYVQVTVISQTECDKSYAAFGGVDDVFFCAKENGSDSCKGDSGGPIALNSVQIGIVSGGVGCAHPNYPGLYTRLSDVTVRTWIKTTAGI